MGNDPDNQITPSPLGCAVIWLFVIRVVWLMEGAVLKTPARYCLLCSESIYALQRSQCHLKCIDYISDPSLRLSCRFTDRLEQFVLRGFTNLKALITASIISSAITAISDTLGFDFRSSRSTDARSRSYDSPTLRV